jgi:uncharacterized protein YdeI (YjbR/CyaY-like superfamily)
MTGTKTVAKTFRATLERDGTRLNWIIILIPFDAAKVWGMRGQLKVKGEINGFAFRTSLFPTGDGRHTMLINKRMQAGGRASLGTLARFRLEPDTEERIIRVPPELERALSEDRALRRWFDRLSYSIRKYLTDSVTQVNSAGARERRAGQIAERLLAAMEAERDLPPILRVAFAHDPRAHAGWKRLSSSQRRMHLLGIFYYSSPAARARRLAKAMEDARRRADP